MQLGKLTIRKRKGSLVISWDGRTPPKRTAFTEAKPLANAKPGALKEPSPMFDRAFSARAGTISATCELCGTNIATREGLEHYGDDGELEEFQKNMEAKPEKYLLWEDCDGVSLGHVDGRQFVLGCPCNIARRYENFVINDRYAIADYLRAYAKQKAEKAALQQEMLGVIPEIEALEA